MELYDLEADIAETNNVADANQELVAKMAAKALAFDAKVKGGLREIGKLPETDAVEAKPATK